MCDLAEAPIVRNAFKNGVISPGSALGAKTVPDVFVCEADLEDELIRSAGADLVEEVISREGDANSWRLFRNQPAQRGRDIETQLRRFMGTQSGRKVRYAKLMVDAIDLAKTPTPLDGVVSFALG